MNNLEIERKWTVDLDKLKESINLGISVVSTEFELFQGYVETTDPTKVVRYRVNETQKRAYHTMKSFISEGQNQEIEFEIPYPDGKAAIANCDRGLHKTRQHIYYKNQKFEVDTIHAGDDSLLIAELELNDINQPVEIPDWINDEVTSSPAYSNYSLSKIFS